MGKAYFRILKQPELYQFAVDQLDAQIDKCYNKYAKEGPEIE